jgi:hypothetical protein
MNAHVSIPVDAAAIEARFADLCDNRAVLYIEGVLDLHEAVDECHGYAVLSGVIDRIGQDETQHVMAVAFAAPDLLPDIEQVNFEIGDIVRRWELADSRDRWKWTGEAPPPPDDMPIAPRRSYRTPEAVEQEFWHIASHEPDRLAAWLADHPADEAHLFKLWKAKRCS